METEIDNINDRRNLVLLKYWKDKPRKWMRKHKSLSYRYVDNKKFESNIIDELKYIELLGITNSEIVRDEYGRPKYRHPDLPKELYTTSKGIDALKNKSYPSEMRKEMSERRFILFQVIGILIAAIGGVITIFTTLFD